MDITQFAKEFYQSILTQASTSNFIHEDDKEYFSKMEAITNADRFRALIERGIVRFALEEIFTYAKTRGASVTVSISNGFRHMLEDSARINEIMNNIMSTDGDTLILKSEDKNLNGWIDLVYGVDGPEVVVDHSMSPLLDHADELSWLCQQLFKEKRPYELLGPKSGYQGWLTNGDRVQICDDIFAEDGNVSIERNTVGTILSKTESGAIVLMDAGQECISNLTGSRVFFVPNHSINIA